MGLKDLVITPIYIIIFSLIACFLRPYLTNSRTRKYFLPALWMRFAGAIALGLIYQFYYDGGDTFNFWEHGSKWIYEAFQKEPAVGLKMLLSEGGERLVDETYEFSSRIWYYRDSHSYFIVRLATLFDLFTFHTYSATALFFAILSFSGAWALFSILTEKYSIWSNWWIFGLLFFPSVLFWGSGILKDTLTLSSMCWMTWSLMRWIQFRRFGVSELAAFGLGLYLLISIKIYVAICYLPMIFVWLFFIYLKQVSSTVLRILTLPLVLLAFGGGAFFVLIKISSQSNKYNLENIVDRARVTAYDIRYGWGNRTSGDGGYDIGLPDGTLSGTLNLAPAAINVTLFRPYLWEVRNPLMLLSALESLLVLSLTFNFFLKGGWKNVWNDPFLIFCIAFVLVFAFAVGVSTFNFGTLMRYKIPLYPFLLALLCSNVKMRSNG